MRARIIFVARMMRPGALSLSLYEDELDGFALFGPLLVCNTGLRTDALECCRSTILETAPSSGTVG